MIISVDFRRGVAAQPIYNGYCHSTEKYGILPRVDVNTGNGYKVSVTISVFIMSLTVSIFW